MYISYEKSLSILQLDTLQDRRTSLCGIFARKGLKNNTLNDIFVRNTKKHGMITRYADKFNVQYANTERLKMSAIPQMQRILNMSEEAT